MLIIIMSIQYKVYYVDNNYEVYFTNGRGTVRRGY